MKVCPAITCRFRSPRNVPACREFRTQSFYGAYSEGWGLYAESLSKEMGFFTDPYSDFGRVGAEMWRAVRLVVDTGMHAKGWTEQQAVAYPPREHPWRRERSAPRCSATSCGPGRPPPTRSAR